MIEITCTGKKGKIDTQTRMHILIRVFCAREKESIRRLKRRQNTEKEMRRREEHR